MKHRCLSKDPNFGIYSRRISESGSDTIKYAQIIAEQKTILDIIEEEKLVIPLEDFFQIVSRNMVFVLS
jgi:hypothetical protein